MGAADVRDVIVERQRELASRHEVLGREGRNPGRYEDLLLRVFDATNDLIKELDKAQARSARRRRLLAGILLGVAAGTTVLVAVGPLPAPGLIAAAVALGAAVVMWSMARIGAPPPARPERPEDKEGKERGDEKPDVLPRTDKAGT